jgi:hypothetical protein
MRINNDRLKRRSGSVLLAVLIVLPLLFLAAAQFGELMLQEYAAADSAMKAMQARALAKSGVNYCAVYLTNPTAVSGNFNGNVYSNTGAFQNIQVNNADGTTAGRFSIVAPYDYNASTGTNSQSGFRYGVIDESSKININALAQSSLSDTQFYQVLLNLNPNTMTQQISDSIRDWIDKDDTARTNGAENTYYQALMPAYSCKNAPLDTVEEMLLIQGITPQVLFGSDWNRNGSQDPGEDSGSGWDPGIAPYITVYSRELNVDSTNNPRINLKGSNLTTIHDSLVTAVGQSVADFIVLYLGTQGTPTPGGGGRAAQASAQDISTKVQALLKDTNYKAPAGLSSVFQLLTANVTFQTGTGRNMKTVQVTNPLSDKSQQSTVLATLLDKTTTSSAKEFPGRVNVLTASETVLNAFVGIGGLTSTDVQSILQSRPDPTQGTPTDTVYQSLAWLIVDANLTATKVQALETYFTSRSTVYRVQSIGYFDNGGPYARVEAVIDTTNGYPRIVMWRDLSELGKGYAITTTNN